MSNLVRKNSLTGLTICLIVFSAATAWATTLQEEKSYENLKKLLGEGKKDEGAKAAQDFIKQFSESDYLSEIKFFLAESETNLYQALKKYEAILKDYPQSKFASLSQARIAEHYFTRGNFYQARVEWEKYLKLFPEGENKEEAFLAIGICYYQEKKINKAIDCFKEFINLYPESFLIPQARFNLASAYLNRGKIEPAEEELKALLEMSPQWENKAAVYQRLSEVYLEKGEERKSQEILARLNQEFPQPLGREKPEGRASFPLEKEKKLFYSIQVGAFSEKERAEKLYRELKKKGYQAYLVSAKKEGMTFYRIRIGEFPDEEKAKLKAEEIEAREGLPALVVFKDE